MSMTLIFPIKQMHIFLLKMYERDEGSNKFLKRISKKHTYNTFNNSEELINQVKESLTIFIIEQSHRRNFDDRIIKNSSCDDVDSKAVELFFDCLTDENVKKLKGLRDIDKILDILVLEKLMN